ncbi:MAG: RBBP9/YdeN family alpha/beta hydrolase [Acidimicrobiales bacterium]
MLALRRGDRRRGDTSEVPFLFIHGAGGSAPEHWQSWLAERLRALGEEVAFPQLPDPDSPRLDRWLEALHTELGRLPLEQTTVICHSLGCLLWLHYTAEHPREEVARVLLVARRPTGLADPAPEPTSLGS